MHYTLTTKSSFVIVLLHCLRPHLEENNTKRKGDKDKSRCSTSSYFIICPNNKAALSNKTKELNFKYTVKITAYNSTSNTNLHGFSLKKFARKNTRTSIQTEVLIDLQRFQPYNQKYPNNTIEDMSLENATLTTNACLVETPNRGIEMDY